MEKSLQKVICIGNPYFMLDLSLFDWETIFIETCVSRDQPVYTWDSIIGMAGFEPDIVFVGDRSMAPFVVGVESFPCLTVFYCIDSHIHEQHFYYAQGFDICLMSLYDHRPKMQNRYLQNDQIWWFPAYAPNIEEYPALLPDAEKVEFCWDCLFVGNLSTPERICFLNELEENISDLHITTGNFRTLFSQGRIIINEATRGDLNFRVFESLGSGSCLVTPYIENNMLSLFEDKVHLYTYPIGNVKEAANIIQHLLDNPNKQEEMRRNALNVINNKHRRIDRAREFSTRIRYYYANGGYERMLKRRKDAKNILKKWLKLPYLFLSKSYGDNELTDYYFSAAMGKYTK